MLVARDDRVRAVFPSRRNLLYRAGAIIIVLVWGVRLGLLLSALNVYLRDIQYLVEVAMLILFWASPIVYSWSFVVDAAVRSGLRGCTRSTC